MLNKQTLDINFAQGVDQKTDPKRVPAGKFLTLVNSVFTKAGPLTKRNGFGPLSALPNTSALFLTTFNNNLTAIGTSVLAYSPATMGWVSRGAIKAVDLNTLPLIRSNTNQTQCDSAVSPTGLICTVFSDSTGSATTYKYAIANVDTGQNIVAPTLIPVSSGTVSGGLRVFVLGSFFIIMFTNTITGTKHLQYIAVSASDSTQVTANADIAGSVVSAGQMSWDAKVVNSNLYVAYNTTAGGQSVKVTYLTQGFVVATPITFAASIATLMSVTADMTTPSAPIIYASFYDVAGTTAYSLAVDQSLNQVLAPTQFLAAGTVLNVTSAALAGVLTVFYQLHATYSYDAAIGTDFTATKTITQAGVVSAQTTVKRGMSIASKAFFIDTTVYFLGAYTSANQPTFFLLDSTGTIVSKMAYSNAVLSGLGLASVTVTESVAQVSYLTKTSIQSVNKTQGSAVSAGVYAQTGINLASFNIGAITTTTAEIGNNLNLSGGFIWAYDGYLPVEQGFHLWPDYVEVTTSTTGGSLPDQIYYYVATYEWSDNQGNLFRSAPSIPVTITTTGGATSTNTINVPTLRATAKTANPVKIVVYRWSTAQQTYYQVTSITTPTLNDTTTDSVAVTDTLADTSIIGNNILYTTGGVIENIGAPAASNLTLFNDRLFFVYAEDRNLLGFSKQVIESTPVELSDLLTIYVAPSLGAQGPTGPMTAISAMDDKLILFKKNAINYINGSGPDNTGANSQYSDPIFITSVIGCDNQNSIVFIPTGLIFQSDKGLWLLGRDLSTKYIGAPVEDSTQTALVLSALTIPGTTQVRFTLDSGVTLMYDYFYDQWGTFANVPGVSSTLYQDLHTYLDSYGRVFQETPGLYLDNSSPVLMSFTTGWMNLAGFQGYERFYFMFINGDYLSPFNLYCSFAYDFNPSPTQATRVIPDNIPSNWGSSTSWGTGGEAWGGSPRNFEARVFPEVQKCESFQISMQELYDPSFGVAAGAGLTLSGLSIVAGIKKGYRTSSASRSFG